MKVIIFSSFFLALFACIAPSNFANSEPNKQKELYKSGEITLPSKEIIKVTLAISNNEQTRGLSGVASKNWKDDQAMLFFYANDDYRKFWMPNTYFNLDIFFLDRDLTVLAVDRNVQHYIGRKNPAKIPTTRSVFCRHVLEMKSTSPLSKKIVPGNKLKWTSPISLLQIELDIHRHQ